MPSEIKQFHFLRKTIAKPTPKSSVIQSDEKIIRKVNNFRLFRNENHPCPIFKEVKQDELHLKEKETWDSTVKKKQRANFNGKKS